MRKNLFLCLVICASICIVSARLLMAQPVPTIDSILLANEFKAEQRAQLNMLPLSSVSELTQRLNDAAPDDERAGRLFEFLALKVRQFEPELPKAAREAAIEALKRKTKSATAPVTEYRQSLLKWLQAPQVVEPKTPQLLDQNIKPQAAAQRPSESKPVLPTPNISEPTASSTPWSIIVVLIVAAISLLWLLVKKRK